jgi:hypothetical protein
VKFRVVTQTSMEPQERLFEVYRFYGAAGGPTSHVFTLDQQECFAVEQSGVWQYEGVAFFAGAPLADGSCRVPGSRAVRRLWRPTGESRHRLVTDPGVLDAMTALGWIDEGPVMCVAG